MEWRSIARWGHDAVAVGDLGAVGPKLVSSVQTRTAVDLISAQWMIQDAVTHATEYTSPPDTLTYSGLQHIAMANVDADPATELFLVAEPAYQGG